MLRNPNNRKGKDLTQSRKVVSYDSISIVLHKIPAIDFRETGTQRTIVDAFRYLSKEIAIKALKMAVSGRSKKKLDIKKLQQYAKQFGLNLDSYILTVTT